MKIDLNIDTTALMQRMGLSEKNLAYAAVNAINQTAKQVQEQARANVKSRFVLRQPDFILKQAAIIKPFASVGQGRPYAEIQVGQKDRLLLPIFEAGGTRRPFVGANVAVPITGSPARPSFESPVISGLRVTALGLQPVLSSAQKRQRKSLKGSNAKETRAMRKEFTRAAGAGQVWKGKQRTYMIPGVGIFQRQGKAKDATVMLYKFSSSPQLKPKLGFLAMAQQQGRGWLADNMEHFVIAELNRNRR